MNNMMKPLFLIAATTLLLCACTSQEPESPADGNHLPRRIGMEVLATSTNELSPVVRATTATTITSGSIGVFLHPKTTGEYDVKKNVRYTASTVSGSTKWTSADPLFFTSYMALVCAYHPYGAAQTYENCEAMPLATQEYNAAYDLSYAGDIPMNATLGVATGIESGAGNQVNFKMKRAYALLDLNFKRGALKDDVVISRIEVAATGLKSANTLNIRTGVYGTPVAATDSKFALVKDVTVPRNTAVTPVTQSLLMVPATGLSGMKLTLTLKQAGSPTMSVAVGSITAFERGKRYILNLTVNGTSVDFDSMTVQTGWDDEAMANSDGSTTLRPQ